MSNFKRLIENIKNQDENADLIAAFKAKGGKTIYGAPAVKAAISDKAWERATQGGGKFNAVLASDGRSRQMTSAPRMGRGDTLSGKEVAPDTAYERDTPEQLPVRHDTKTGPKGGGVVKTRYSYGGNTKQGGRAEINTGTTDASATATEIRRNIQGPPTEMGALPLPIKDTKPVQGPTQSGVLPKKPDPIGTTRSAELEPDEYDKEVHGDYNRRPKPPKIDPLSKTVSTDHVRANAETPVARSSMAQDPVSINKGKEPFEVGWNNLGAATNRSRGANALGIIEKGIRIGERAQGMGMSREALSQRILAARSARLRKEEEELSGNQLTEKYTGFKKLAEKVGPAIAAAIGRKKYGKDKFNKYAKQGRKMKGLQKEELFSDEELLRLQEIGTSFEADDLDEARKRGGKRISTNNIPVHRFDTNSDQSGYNTNQNVASVNGGAPTISDEYTPTETLLEGPKTIITADQPIKHIGQLPGSAAAPIQAAKLGSSLNGPKNPNKLQDVATKRDNAAPHTIEQTNEENEVDIAMRAMIEPLHVLPVYNDSSRNTLLASWAVRNKARLR